MNDVAHQLRELKNIYVAQKWPEPWLVLLLERAASTIEGLEDALLIWHEACDKQEIERARERTLHLLVAFRTQKECPYCGVYCVSGAAHFSGCKLHPGEKCSAQTVDVGQ